MNLRHILSLSAIAALGLALLPGNAVSQQKSLKEQLTGTWVVVAVNNTMPDGKKQQNFGPNPQGILLLDASGQYAQLLVRPDIPKFKVNNRMKGTPEENTAAVHGTSATLGTWSVDETSKTITVRYGSGLFPNQAGSEAKRIVVSVTADELRLTAPTTASGTRADNVFRRAK